jgi:hypothetical protein
MDEREKVRGGKKQIGTRGRQEGDRMAIERRPE